MSNFEKFRQIFTSKKAEVDFASEIERRREEDLKKQEQQQILNKRYDRLSDIKQKFNNIGLIDLLDEIVRNNIVIYRDRCYDNFGKRVKYSPAIIEWKLNDPRYASIGLRSGVELKYDEGKYIEIDSDLVLHYAINNGGNVDEKSVNLTKDNLEISIANALAVNTQFHGGGEDNSWG